MLRNYRRAIVTSRANLLTQILHRRGREKDVALLLKLEIRCVRKARDPNIKNSGEEKKMNRGEDMLQRATCYTKVTWKIQY